ncbi:MAG: DUF1573 domain-containing protein [Saprospiraceae bacterium]
MFKSFRLAILALAAFAFLASCNEDGSADVRDAARATVESAGAAASGAADAATSAAANAAATVANAVPTGPTTVMSFDETTFDFGTVTEGEKVSHTYNFKNTGDEPLILQNAKGSCGCTVPQWPREPIAPGASGEVVVEFNSKGKAGDRNQKVTITSNTNPAQSFIYLKGKVNKAGGESPLVQ